MKNPLRNRTRRWVCAILAGLLLAAVLALSVSGAEESGAPVLVSEDYLQKQLDALRQELLDAIGKAAAGGETAEEVQSAYRDVTLPRGSVITLRGDAEVIFRGGNAVVLTVTGDEGEGLTDLASGEERFSGEGLQFAHIYYPTTTRACVCLLVTGERAAFTLKGTYEINES